MDEQQFLKQLNTIKDIPTLPTIVFELNQHLENPDSSIASVSQTIERDQAMALKVLKIVNSAFYGFKSKISDIKNAVILLGFIAVRNAIISVSIINSLPRNVLFRDFEMDAFWKHSLAVAVTSKNIAQKTGVESPDNCFVCGLLHDVGKVILAQYFQDLFVKVWTCMQNESLPFHEAEQHVLSIDHARIGAHLAERWALPKGLIEAIRWHQDYRPEIPNAKLVKIIYLADILVNSYDKNPDCEIDMAAVHPDAVNFLLEQLEDSRDWYSHLTNEIEAAYSIFLDSEK